MRAPKRALRVSYVDTTEKRGWGSVLLNFMFMQNHVSIVFCQLKPVKVRLGRRPSGYGLTSRLSALTGFNRRAQFRGWGPPAMPRRQKTIETKLW
jgi:hypothetical protein